MAITLTRQQLREQVARELDDLGEGSFTGVPTTTDLRDSVNRLEEDSFWKGGELYVTSGAQANTSRIVSAFLSATSQFTTNAFAGAPAAGNTYVVYRLWRVSQYNNAIDAATRSIWQHLLTDLVDTSLVVVNNQWRYAIPSTFNYLYRVQVQNPVMTDNYIEVPARRWSVLRDPAGAKVEIDWDWLAKYGVVGKIIQLNGQGYVSLFADDTTASSGLPENYLKSMVKYLLLLAKAMGRQDQRGYWEKAQFIFQGELAQARADIHPMKGLRGNSKRVA